MSVCMRDMTCALNAPSTCHYKNIIIISIMVAEDILYVPC